MNTSRHVKKMNINLKKKPQTNKQTKGKRKVRCENPNTEENESLKRKRT